MPSKGSDISEDSELFTGQPAPKISECMERTMQAADNDKFYRYILNIRCPRNEGAKKPWTDMDIRIWSPAEVPQWETDGGASLFPLLTAH